MASDFLAGMILAVVVSIATTPVGVSGAVFLAPAQVGILGTPSPQVTPTNLIYNVIAIPGSLFRFARAGSLWNDLTRLLLWGTAPGMVIGAIIRSQHLASADAFQVVMAVVLLPLGIWMTFFDRPTGEGKGRSLPVRGVFALALLVGVVGGIYGIGGGSILAPVLVGLGYRVAQVAPAALTATFVTSVIGVGAFLGIGLTSDQNLAPDWLTGLALGLGGLAGSYLGAALQPRLPERLLRRFLGLLAVAVAVTYLVLLGA